MRVEVLKEGHVLVYGRDVLGVAADAWQGEMVDQCLQNSALGPVAVVVHARSSHRPLTLWAGLGRHNLCSRGNSHRSYYHTNFRFTLSPKKEAQINALFPGQEAVSISL